MTFNLAALIMVIFTGLSRLAEIGVGEKNALKMLKEKEGREFSAWQRPPVFVIYAIWLGALLWFVPADQPVEAFALILFVLLQGLRWWAIAHLKEFWTTRIVIVPLAWKIITGPYQFFRHPIYVALVGEVFALSLAFQQLELAALFGGLTLIWVSVRIRSESRALKMML